MALIVVTMSYTMTLILKDKPVRHPAFTSGLDYYDCVGRPSFHCDHSSFDGKPPLTQPSQRGLLSSLGLRRFSNWSWMTLSWSCNCCLKVSNWVGSMIDRDA
jgi:hypothetical protein